MPLQLAGLLQKPPFVVPQVPAALCCRQQVTLVLQQCSNCRGGSTTAAPVAGCHASSTVAVSMGLICLGRCSALTPLQLAQCLVESTAGAAALPAVPDSHGIGGIKAYCCAS